MLAVVKTKLFHHIKNMCSYFLQQKQKIVYEFLLMIRINIWSCTYRISLEFNVLVIISQFYLVVLPSIDLMRSGKVQEFV